MTKKVDTRLRRHLRRWLGRWPPTTTGLDVIGSIRRTQPEWDGRIYPVVGITDPFAGVLSVPPAAGPRVRARAPLVGRRRLAAELPELVGEPGRLVYTGVFRWCQRPATLSEAGVWVDADDSAVPDWLRPFGHQVLIARDPETGAYLAGVGIKHHDRYGRSWPSVRSHRCVAAAWRVGSSRRPPDACLTRARSRPTNTRPATSPRRESPRPQASPTMVGGPSGWADASSVVRGFPPRGQGR
jgi:hypothetical protein